jgi:hypothetical protein
LAELIVRAVVIEVTGAQWTAFAADVVDTGLTGVAIVIAGAARLAFAWRAARREHCQTTKDYERAEGESGHELYLH